MKNFFKQNIGVIIKLLINQIGMMIFGFAVTTAAVVIAGTPGLVVSGIFSVVFYLVLLYNTVWEAGAKDKIRIDGNREKYSGAKGFWLSFAANIPNLLLAVLILIGFIFGRADGAFGYEWAGSLHFVAGFAAMVLEGMYLGLILVLMPGNPAVYFIIIIPALLVCTVAYIFGAKTIRIGKFFGITSKAEKQIEAHNLSLKKHHVGSDGLESDDDGSI